MQVDLGLQGLGILIAVSLVFGAIAQVVLGRGTTRLMWLIGAVAWFVGGLAFDESLLGGLVVGVPVVLVTRYVARRRNRPHQPLAA